MRRFLAALILLASAVTADAQSTRIPSYANGLGWSLLPRGPALVNMGGTPSATDCLIAGNSIWVATGVYNSANPAASTSTIQRYDPNTLTLQASIPVSGWLHGLATSPGKVWASDLYGNRVYRVDLGANAVDATIPGVTSPGGMTYGNGIVVVSNRLTPVGTVTVIDAAGAAILRTLPVGDLPFFPDYTGADFRVPNFNGNSISVIDKNGLAVTSTIALPSSSQNPFAYLSDGVLGYVSNWGGSLPSSVSVIDEASGAVVDTWPVPNNAAGVSAQLHFMQIIRETLWVTASQHNLLYGLNRMNKGAIVASIPTGHDPAGLCYDGIDEFQLDYSAGVLHRRNTDHAQH